MLRPNPIMKKTQHKTEISEDQKVQEGTRSGRNLTKSKDSILELFFFNFVMKPLYLISSSLLSYELWLSVSQVRPALLS